MWNKMWNCAELNLKRWNYVEYKCGINDAYVEKERGIMWNKMLSAWNNFGCNLGAFGCQTGHQQI
jgi:hypothetical protein